MWRTPIGWSEPWQVAEPLFEINRYLKLLGKDVEKFMFCEKAKLIIPENLKPPAKLKCSDKGRKNLCDGEEIIDLCRNIKEVLDIEYGQHQ